MRTTSAIFTVLLSLAMAPLARSQSLTISTLAGSTGQGSVDGTGSVARFSNPWGVAVAGNGDIYVADTDNNTIRKITSGGAASVFAGTPGVSGTNNGLLASALFNQPQGVALDSAGNVYVADTGNHTIRKITLGGIVTTLAGSAGVSGSTDATGTGASFNGPQGIAVTSSGNLIYVADTWNHTIRQITSLGVVSTLAGSTGNPGSGNGSGTGASFNQPEGLALDAAGNVYVGDTGNQMIRMVTAGGTVTTLAGSAGNYGSANASGTSAQFWGPQGLAVDSATNVYVADSLNNAIRKITSAGAVSTFAGSIGAAGSADDTGTAAQFSLPQGLAVDSSGNVYVADSANNTIRKITSGAVVTTLAGFASTGTNDATGASARFFAPAGSAIDSSGNTYVADTGNNTIRKITAGGAVTTLAGSPGVSGSADATGGNARFNHPQGITVDSSGNIYVADTANHTIRKVTSGGGVTTLAGGAGTNDIVDGTGTAARFNSPRGVAVDSSGNVYVADTWNHTIRKITSGGIVTTLAGLPNFYGNLDSNMPEFGTNKARFNAPEGIAVDIAGNIYVADTRNHTIRKVTAAGTVSTLAGLAGSYGSADGTNNVARFNLPQSLAVDANTNIYVVDSGNHTLRKITPVGTNWVVTTVAGQAGVYGSTDGNSTAARFFFPAAIAVNASGSFAVADLGNNIIRSGSSAVGSAPLILSQPADLTVGQNTNAVFSVSVAGSAPLIYQWLYNGANISGAAASTYTVTAAQTSNDGSYSVIVTNALGAVTSQVATLTVIIPPAITSQPQNVTTNQGSNATFSVTTTGTSPAYQWFLNGSPISTATNATLVRSNIQPNDEGSYSVIVSNVAGSVTSSDAVLTVIQVPTPPGISSQPQNLTVAQSSNATFSVTATGSTPMVFKWLFGGSPVAGGTASSYTVTNAQSGNAGSYSVIATNAYGAVTSSVATLSIVAPPIISVPPASQVTAVSNSVTFSVSLSQGTSPAYQWRNNGAPIAGATQSSFSIASVSRSDAATYSVVVSNFAATVTSSGALLSVQQSQVTFFDDFESYQGGALDFNVTGSPNTDPSNPWFAFTTSSPRGIVTNSLTGVTPHSGSQMVGANGTVRQDYLNIMSRFNAGQPYYGNFMCDWWFYDPSGTNTPAATNANEYMALCSDTGISTTTDASASAGTVNQRMSLGTFNSAGYNYLNYQVRIIGGITNVGNFGSGNSWYNAATVRSVGWHHARFVAGIPNSTNSCAISVYIDNMTNATVYSALSGTAGFNVLEMNHALASTAPLTWFYDDVTFRAANDPWIVEQPAGLTVNPGEAATFTTVAVGSAFQWQFNGNNISGATTNVYSIPSVAATNAGDYVCVITGTNGTLATTAATLSVSGAPVITASPQSLTVTQGQNAAFSVTSSGTGLTYQWLFNSAPISSATASAYTRTNAQAANAGSYSVIVTNLSGSVTSSVAVLTVQVPVSIVTPPSSQSLAAGATASFSISVNGTAPFAYQWKLNSSPIAGATNSTYSRTNVHTADAGTYTVVVTNVVGSANSSAILTVNNPPVFTPVANFSVHAGANVLVTNVVTDSDLPAQSLIYALLPGAPAASAVGFTTGVFHWQTTSNDLNTVGVISVRVTDSGTPSLSATNTYTISVIDKPTLGASPANGGITLSWSAIANDSYQVQYRTNVSQADWTLLTTVKATNSTATCTDNTTDPVMRIYRVMLAP